MSGWVLPIRRVSVLLQSRVGWLGLGGRWGAGYCTDRAGGVKLGLVGLGWVGGEGLVGCVSLCWLGEVFGEVWVRLGGGEEGEGDEFFCL